MVKVLDPECTYSKELANFERGFLKDALILNDWKIEPTSKMLGVSPHFIRTRKRELNVFAPTETKISEKFHDKLNATQQLLDGEDKPPDESIGETGFDDNQEAGSPD